MERWLKPSKGMVLGRGIMAAVGAVDLVVTSALIFNYLFVVPTDARSLFALSLNVLHAFTWTFAMVISTNIVSSPLVVATAILYLVSSFLDVGSFFLRLGLVRAVGGLFAWFTFAISIVYLALAVLVFFTALRLNVLTKRFRLRMVRKTRTDTRTDPNATNLHKVYIWLERLRLWMSSLWWIELAIVIALAALTLFSTLVNLSSYTVLLLFDLPHVFVWVFARAAAGTMPQFPPDAAAERRYIDAFFAIYLVVALLGLGGTVLRLLVLVPETTNPTLGSTFLNFWRQVSLWLSFSLSTVLFTIAVVDAVILNRMKRYVKLHEDRTRAAGLFLAKMWNADILDDDSTNLEAFEEVPKERRPSRLEKTLAKRAPKKGAAPKGKFETKIIEQLQRRAAKKTPPRPVPTPLPEEEEVEMEEIGVGAEAEVEVEFKKEDVVYAVVVPEEVPGTNGHPRAEPGGGEVEFKEDDVVYAVIPADEGGRG